MNHVPPALLRGLSFADYIAIDAAHFSTLRALDVSPLHYRHAVANPPAETDAMRLGRVAHALVLTGSLPDDMAAFDGKVRRGKAWDDFAAEHAGKDIVRKADLDAAEAMRAAVLANAEARELLRCGDAEVTMRWVDGGVRCKGRLDWYTGERIVELKSTRSIAPRLFLRECATRFYHAQLAFYSAGFEAITGAPPAVLPALIAVENAPPYDVAVYRVGFDALEAGARKVEEWLDRLRACERTGHWPGVSGAGPMDLRLPDWALAGDDVEVNFAGVEGG